MVNMDPIMVIAAVAGVALGGLSAALLVIVLRGHRIREAEKHAADLLIEAKTKHKEALLEAKEEAIKIKSQAEGEIRERMLTLIVSQNASPRGKRTSIEKLRPWNAETAI